MEIHQKIIVAIVFLNLAAFVLKFSLVLYLFKENTEENVSGLQPDNNLELFQLKLLALHARLSLILSTSEFLDGSELHCFHFDEHSQRFVSNKCVPSDASSLPLPKSTFETELAEEKNAPLDDDGWDLSVRNDFFLKPRSY